MGRSIHFLTFVGTLTILFIFSLQSYAELRSPCMLTESEKNMIIELTCIYKNSHPKQKDAKECLILGFRTILIRYENGHVGLFGMGEVTVLNNIQEGLRNTETLNGLHEIIIPHSGTEHERELFTALAQVWQSAPSPDHLPPEQLARADALVQELFITTPSDKIQLAVYNSLGLRGNRYLSVIKNLPSLSPEAEITFYEGYLDNQFFDMHTQNIPTDSEKQTAIKKLLRVLETQYGNKSYVFSSAVSQEIRRLDPMAYEVFEQNGMIDDAVSPQ